MGMSSLWNFESYLETEFTGVLPEGYRGRGVAEAALHEARSYGHPLRAQQHRFPTEIRTTNDFR